MRPFCANISMIKKQNVLTTKIVTIKRLGIYLLSICVSTYVFW